MSEGQDSEKNINVITTEEENPIASKEEKVNEESEKTKQNDIDKNGDDTQSPEEQKDKNNLEEDERDIIESEEKNNEANSIMENLITNNMDNEAKEQPPDIEEIDAATTPPPPPLNDIMEGDESGHEEVDRDEVDDEDEDSQIYDRDILLQQYKEALEERSRIQSLNQQYQHKLAEYFKKKKTDERGEEIEKNVTDQEQRYLKYMSNLEELQVVERRQASSLEMQMEELKGKCQEKQNLVEDASSSFMKSKYDTAKDSISTRSGKPIPVKDLEQYQQAELKKESEVIAVRLENIKLKNRLKKREQQLKAKEELAEGLHLIDFEQLKIENQTYNEKIEERNEELLKLRKKINSTVQVLTHLKEKLQHVQGENGEQRENLRDIEVTVAQKRDVLTRLKQARDSLRFDNTKLKHKAGLLGNKPLLRDYEERKDESEELRDRLGDLKEHHIELNINLTTVRKKIDNAKSMM